MLRIATVSMQVSLDPDSNMRHILRYLEQAKANGAELVVFPEAVIQGYLTNLKEVRQEDLKYQRKHAEVIPQGKFVSQLLRKALEMELYLAFGMMETNASRNHLWNTMVLCGPKGLIGKYRKVHQPGCEGEVYTSGSGFQVYETPIGKIGLLICFDKTFPEACRTMALKGAQLILMSTAWPLMGESSQWKTDPKLHSYEIYDQARALENQVFFVSSNQFGCCGDLFYLGHSNIVSPIGEILASTGFGEGIAYADVDIAGEIPKIKQTVFYDLLSRRKPETYEL